MTRSILFLLLIISSLSCSPIKKYKDLISIDNLEFYKETEVVGIYTKCVLSKRPDRVHKGHYQVVLSDSAAIVLLPPYLDESIRPQEEVQRLEGKKVMVRGTIVPKTYFEKPSLDHRPLSVNKPCFSSINSIKLVD